MNLQIFRKAPVPLSVVGTVVSPLRDLSNEPVLNMSSIQSDLLLGHAKKEEAIVFFKITDPSTFANFLIDLPITSAAAVFRPDPSHPVALLTEAPPPNPRFAVAFTRSGLSALSRDPGDFGDTSLLGPFSEGLANRAVPELNDSDPSTWVVGGDPADTIDGVFIITGAQVGDVQGALDGPFSDPAGSGFAVVHTLHGEVRPGAAESHEHFGFLDGISQPGIRGCVDPQHKVPLTQNADINQPDQGLAGQDLLWPGAFVLGYPTQIAGAHFTEKGDPVKLPVDWMRDGAFLVVRRLTQKVPEMHAGIAAITPPGQDPAQFEAQIVGRWPNGTPIITHPDGDDPVLGTDENRNNDFEFKNDRLGLTCPWASHIRKTYPRDDVRGNVAPSQAETDSEEARTQTHRLLRRGIQFGKEVTATEQSSGITEQDRGLLFKCYVTDLKNQFEFVQKNWCNNTSFVQPDSGHDLIIGQSPNNGARTFSGVGHVGLKPEFTFQPWVTMTGGGYFFAPSIDFINSLTAKVS